MFEYIKDNIARLEERIAAAADGAGRSREEIKIVAVAKAFGDDVTRAAVEFGLTDIGEAKIQDADPKIKNLGPICTWHMVGHLQTNKANRAVFLFDMIQSIDSLRLAEKINAKGFNRDKVIPILIEINASMEENKFGFIPEAAVDIVDQLRILPNLDVRGMMTVGPNTRDRDEIRKAFGLTRTLFENARKYAGETFDTLSMGMSDDLEIAIEEGSNMLRIGTAIFGKRNSK